MKLSKFVSGKVYRVEGQTRITVEKFLNFWDVFVDGSVHQSFGSFNSLAEVEDKLKKYTPEKIIETVNFGDLDS